MARRDARATAPPENELAFAQRKLEENYGKVYQRLEPWRDAFQMGQEVLVWKRPILTALLYVAIHWIFYYFATSNEGFLSQLCSLLFWMLVADAVWRAATRDGQGLEPNNSNSGTRVMRRARRREMTGVVAFERALLLTHEDRHCQQLVPFEVTCLTLAQWWMLLDNLWLALRHWSINDPLMFTVSLAVPGLCLAMIGKYIPTLVVLYILVMGVIVWPYIQYHDLIQKAAALFSAHFPVFLQRAKDWWQFLKTLLFTRDESALREFSLTEGGDDNHTQELLTDELDQIITQPGADEEERWEGSEGGSGGGADGRGWREETESTARRRAMRRVDPGMSVLQDSVLGMTADAFHDIEDSLASFGPGPGEFPSISNLDQSLTLPQFPPEDTDHHSVPFPTPNLSTIQESEEDEDIYGTDVLETGVRHRSTAPLSSTSQQHQQPRSHPPAQYSSSVPVTGSDHYLSEQDTQSGNRTPPPPYESVFLPSSSDGIAAGSYGFDYRYKYPRLDEELQQKGVPKSSSTPMLNGQQ